MMHDFLANNRSELIERCIAKVAKREARHATPQQLRNGIPKFLDQLIRTLKNEQTGNPSRGIEISGRSGGDGDVLSEIGVTATAHGKELLMLGYTVDQVVHDYGDLCQAITDLAFERDAPFAVDEFRTLNRCLDNAIADAVTEFSFQRDISITDQQASDLNQRLGFLMHELRNSLNAAVLATSAMEAGSLPMSGATGAVLRRSHVSMERLISRSLAEVRIEGTLITRDRAFAVADFIAEASDVARLRAKARDCVFIVDEVDPLLAVAADRDALSGALENLLSNAFKFTRPGTEVTLSAYAAKDRVLIDVKDHCGGLASEDVAVLFRPFTQRAQDKSGLGLGLSIARQSITDDGGTLTVQNLPGTGCVFTINLPQYLD